jgi:iron complex transport system substrate-binding protein
MIRKPRIETSAFICAAFAFICVFTTLGVTQSAAAGISLADDLGRKVELKQPAQRIVTLAPFLTELVYSAGAGARVVGVSAYSDYPPEARALPQVASAAGNSIESIAALRPDLVLAWQDSIRTEDVERIERFGAHVYVAEARSLADVPRLLTAIGSLTGLDARAAAAAFDAKLADVEREYADRAEVPVFLEIWNHPLTTISGRHFMNEALAVCRARNVFADLPGVAPEVSWEEVYARDPPVVVGIGSAATAEQFRAGWKAHPTLSAVKSGHLVFVAPDRLQRPTARTPDGIAELCAALDGARPGAAAAHGRSQATRGDASRPPRRPDATPTPDVLPPH